MRVPPLRIRAPFLHTPCAVGSSLASCLHCCAFNDATRGATDTHGMSQTIETSVEQSLDDTARALKIYIHNQIAQATLVLSGNSIGEGAPAAAPPPGGNGGLPDVRTTPTLRGSNVDLGL